MRDGLAYLEQMDGDRVAACGFLSQDARHQLQHIAKRYLAIEIQLAIFVLAGHTELRTVRVHYKLHPNCW